MLKPMAMDAPSTHTHAIVEALTRAIVEHRLLPGAKLVEQKLADHFGVSRTLVRQALFQLSQNRLVRMEPARGAFVAAPSAQEARQVFTVRRMLEAEMTRAFMREVSAAKLQALREHIAQEKAAVQAQLDRAKQSGAKWLPLLPDTKVLDETSKLADSEDLRLSKIDVDNMAAGVAAASEAKEQIASGQLTEAKASLERAGKLWPQYVLLASLNESLKKAEKEAAEKAKEEAKSAAP